MKYGIVVPLTEELLDMFFTKSLLAEPNKELLEAVKCVALANLGVPMSRWSQVECEVAKNCLTDTYLFRLRSFTKIDEFYEIRKEGLEYPKRPLKGF